jgi:uncharacterized membrane protein
MHCYSLIVRVIFDFDKFTNTTLQRNMLLMIFFIFCVIFVLFFKWKLWMDVDPWKLDDF